MRHVQRLPLAIYGAIGAVFVGALVVGLVMQNVTDGLIAALAALAILVYGFIGWFRRRYHSPRTTLKEHHSDQFSGGPSVVRMLLGFPTRMIVCVAAIVCAVIRAKDPAVVLAAVLFAQYLAVLLSRQWRGRTFGGSSVE